MNNRIHLLLALGISSAVAISVAATTTLTGWSLFGIDGTPSATPVNVTVPPAPIFQAPPAGNWNGTQMPTFVPAVPPSAPADSNIAVPVSPITDPTPPGMEFPAGLTLDPNSALPSPDDATCNTSATNAAIDTAIAALQQAEQVLHNVKQMNSGTTPVTTPVTCGFLPNRTPRGEQCGGTCPPFHECRYRLVGQGDGPGCRCQPTTIPCGRTSPAGQPIMCGGVCPFNQTCYTTGHPPNGGQPTGCACEQNRIIER